MEYLNIVGRATSLFDEDLLVHKVELDRICNQSRFLVVGGAGTIGMSVVREIFKRNPKTLHVVDISENNMVELVRSIRSSLGYIKGDFRTFSVDIGSIEFDFLVNTYGPYDYIFNLSALKHVRSEKDPFTLMRMIVVNILNTLKTIDVAKKNNSYKYFCVSTDKAANPVNMMGASKKIMELFLQRESISQNISTARFANVAFSDGSLLHGFNNRLINRQAIAAPKDVMRYFITPEESGQLCILSGLLGNNGDIFYPKLSKDEHALKFSDIAIRFLESYGYTPYICSSESEARLMAKELSLKKKWACYFFDSDTTGEKEIEEFFTLNEEKDIQRYKSVGVVRMGDGYINEHLNFFEEKIKFLLNQGYWTKKEIIELFQLVINDFNYIDTEKYLDERM